MKKPSQQTPRRKMIKTVSLLLGRIYARIFILAPTVFGCGFFKPLKEYHKGLTNVNPLFSCFCDGAVFPLTIRSAYLLASVLAISTLQR